VKIRIILTADFNEAGFIPLFATYFYWELEGDWGTGDFYLIMLWILDIFPIWFCKASCWFGSMLGGTPPATPLEPRFLITLIFLLVRVFSYQLS
jgi:hypothetical protein